MNNNKSKVHDATKADIENLKNDMRYVYEAHDNLLKKLFGFVLKVLVII